MRRISNYHSHIALCGHAHGNVEDYVKEAIKYNYEEIGISDHAPIPVFYVGKEMHEYLWLYQMMNRQSFENDYLKQLEYCINKYPNIKILKGLETEYLPGKDVLYNYFLSKVDYLNLGVHYFFHNNKIINTYDNITDKEMEYYAETIEEALQTNYFSCLVHPDLYLYRIDEFTEHHEKIARRIIEAAIKNDVYLEINANGRNRYPREEFWKIAKEYKGLKVVINSDAHRLEHFHGERIDAAIAFAEKVGIEVSEKMELKKHQYKTQYVGHRGASCTGVVNNTLSGFKEGLRRKYCALECDVRVTKDGVFYIHHDPTVTLGQNNFTLESINANNIKPDEDLKIYNWDEIKNLVLSYEYEGNTYFDKLILFEDYLKLCKDNKMKCVIELKYTNGINTEDVSKLYELMEIIEKHEMLDQVFMLTSMKNCLLHIQKKYPLLNLVLLTGDATTTMESVDWCIEHKISMDSYYGRLTKEMIDKLHENDLSVNVWTVNKEEIANEFINYNIDYVTTDKLV